MQTKDGPRQIIIEVSGDGKDIVLRKDETASFFERNAVLSTVIQMPDIKIIPMAEEKTLPEALRPEESKANQTNNNKNGNESKSKREQDRGPEHSRSRTSSGRARAGKKGNKRSKSGKQ